MAGISIHDHQLISCRRFHVALLLVFLICCEEIMAMRMLNGEQWMAQNLVIQSLPRGPVPPSTSNPCTYIPGVPTRGRCTFAGDFSAAHEPPAVTFQFGAVYKTDDGESQQQD